MAAGETTLTIDANSFTDAAGNPNAEITHTIEATTLDPSAAPTLAYAGSTPTNEDEPSFTVGNVQSGADVRVEAVNSATSATVSKRMQNVTSGTMVTIQFTDAANDCDTNADDTYGESCTLVDGAWRFHAYQSEGSSKSETRSATSQSITIDTVDPTITITGPAAGDATSKSVTGTAADTGGSGVASFGYIIDDDGTCPTDTATYTAHTSGTAVSITDDANNEDYVCFFATDNAGNTKVMASGQITGLDTTDPTITISGPASGVANSKSVTGTAADTGGSGVASFGYVIDDDGTCPTDTSTYTTHAAARR